MYYRHKRYKERNKTNNHIFPTAMTVINETTTNPSEIAKAFNNYFAKVARGTLNPSSDFPRKNILISFCP